MDLFWRITFVEALLNVAVFATAVIAYGFVRSIAVRKGWHWRREQALVGALFGGATSLALLLPLHLDGGAAVGGQSILIALTGPIAGDLAIVVALVIAALATWHSVGTLGTDSALVTMAALAAAAAAGAIVKRVIARLSKVRSRVYYAQLPLLALLSSLGGLAGLYLIAGWEVVRSSATATLSSVVAATLVLGTLLLHEKRRHEAELNLRRGTAHLKDANRRLVEQAVELTSARDAAEDSNRAKSRFLANMSHELRTPLNAVIGFAQLIQDQIKGPLNPTYVEYATDIQTSGEHLLSLINDILDLSKAEAGILNFIEDDVDLSSMIDSCLRMMQPQASRASVRISFHPLQYLSVLADERRVRQIILNLLSNAVKFTLPGGSITFSVDRNAAGDAELVIQDTGIGIPELETDRIFEPFYQVDGKLSRLRQGSGLGLPLTKRLVEMHQGRLELRSEIDRGTTVKVVFPAVRVTDLRTVRKNFGISSKL